MAITIDVTNTPIGVGFQNAYARIQTALVQHQSEGGHAVMIDVAIYATIPDDRTANVDMRRYWTDLASLSGDILPAAYAWLMAHPDFSGAVPS